LKRRKPRENFLGKGVRELVRGEKTSEWVKMNQGLRGHSTENFGKRKGKESVLAGVNTSGEF